MNSRYIVDHNEIGHHGPEVDSNHQTGLEDNEPGKQARKYVLKEWQGGY